MAARSKKVKEKWHGTVSGYTNHKCRCQQCRDAHSARMAEYRASRFRTPSGKARKCSTKGCTNKAWAAAGNGLCHVCHGNREELNAT